jgi:diacylglycerol kinase family enzyme
MNPKARSEKAQRARRFIMENAGRFAIYASNSAEEAEELASIFASMNERCVIAAGGDGTMNAIVKGLVGSDTALGILPIGTMNVFARELGVPVENLDRAFEVIDKGETTEVDLFTMNGAPFVQMAGIGFDAQVIAETKWESKKALGPLAYLLSAVKVLGDKPQNEGHLRRGRDLRGGGGAGGQWLALRRAFAPFLKGRQSRQPPRSPRLQGSALPAGAGVHRGHRARRL